MGSSVWKSETELKGSIPHRLQEILTRAVLSLPTGQSGRHGSA